MPQPIVASYCTTFLKPEMLHIYRQVTGLQRYRTFVVTRERMSEDRYPFADVEVAEKRKARKNFIKRFWLKHVKKLPPIYYRGEMTWLLKILERRDADLMHIYFGHTGVHLLPFIKGWDKPCIVSFHGMDVQDRPDKPEYGRQLQDLLETVPLVLARSHSLMDRLKALGCPAEKIRLNRTGIPLEKYPFIEREMPQNGAWHFVQACRLIQKKGLKTSLTAFAKFHALHPQARFTIAGEGPMREEVLETAQALGIADAVTMRGFLDQPQLAALYHEAHVFMHPSQIMEDGNQEGVPNSMLEAMSTGLPVLATLHGGIPEAVENGRTGHLVPERDAEGLFAKMCELTATQESWRAFGDAASASVSAEFEQKRQIEKLESYYDEARAIGAPLMNEPESRAVPGANVSAKPSYDDPALKVAGEGKHSVAYLFERFPSFLQMFCVREVEEMFQQGLNPLVFSIREAEEATPGQFPLAQKVNFLPDDAALTERVKALRKADQIPHEIWETFKYWGDKGDKLRIYEAHYIGTILKAQGIRHVHAHFAGIAARTAYWMKQFFGISYSFTGHANDMFCVGEHPVSFEFLVRDAAFVSTVADFSKKWLQEKFPQYARKIFTVYNGVNVASFSVKPIPAGEPLILSVGRCVEKKGFDVLIAACARLKQRGLAFRCRIIGDGPMKEQFDAQIADLGVGDVVEMLGARGESAVREELGNCTAFVLACVTEKDGGMDNLPTVIMEAMAAGRPSISTPLAGVPEMIVDGETGLLVPERDVEALAVAMEKLITNPARCTQMGQAARALAEARFSTGNTTNILAHLLFRRGRAALTASLLRGKLSVLADSALRIVGF